MKANNIFHLATFAVASFVFLQSHNCYSQNEADAFRKIKSIPSKYQPLPLSAIKPTGRLKQQVQQNLDGFVGHLDSLVPDLIVKDDIYGKNRLTKQVKSKDVGAIGDGGDWQVQFLWWNSETQSNWRDGYIHSAILANDPKHLARIEKYIQRIFATQDEDGYIGIYDKDLRYKFDNENGELWSKASLFRGLLAWYEFKKDKAILSAVERAVADVMVHYPINASHPFYSVNPNSSGLTHGLTFTDVLENLYQLTKKPQYLDYVLFLYQDFSQQVLNEDAQYKKLLDESIPLKGHGVHTYEHLRSVTAAYYASGNPALKQVLENFVTKINKTTTASGGPIGDEWIGGNNANATSTGYEYCSLHELMNSYTSLFSKSGDPAFADKAAHLFFNAAQGALHPSENCIAYLKTDNSYFMTGPQNGDTSHKTQTRYKYSPVHQDAAVCCVPNAGRITPYYIKNMWLKDETGLVASLLGPCEVTTTWKGKQIRIKENTAYPNNYLIDFEVSTNAAVPFTLKIRKPDWVTRFKVSESYREKDGYIVIDKVWTKNKKVSLQFFPEVAVKQDLNNEYYFTYGPLVLAHALEATETPGRQYPVEGFRDLLYKAVAPVVYNYVNAPVTASGKRPLQFSTTLFNSSSKQNETVLLEPMGGTILRQVTFKGK